MSGGVRSFYYFFFFQIDTVLWGWGLLAARRMGGDIINSKLLISAIVLSISRFYNRLSCVSEYIQGKISA